MDNHSKDFKNPPYLQVPIIHHWNLFEPRVIGKHGKKDIWDVKKARIFFDAMKGAKKDIIDAININVSIGEN
jgi:hypothetical protein